MANYFVYRIPQYPQTSTDQKIPQWNVQNVSSQEILFNHSPIDGAAAAIHAQAIESVRQDIDMKRNEKTSQDIEKLLLDVTKQGKKAEIQQILNDPNTQPEHMLDALEFANANDLKDVVRLFLQNPKLNPMNHKTYIDWKTDTYERLVDNHFRYFDGTSSLVNIKGILESIRPKEDGQTAKIAAALLQSMVKNFLAKTADFVN